MSRTRISKIAIVKPCCIGDCVMALPAIDSICRASPNAKVDVFVGEHSAGVYADRPGIAVRILNPDIATWRDIRRIHSSFRDNYDEIFILDRSRLIEIAAQFTGAKQYRQDRDTTLDMHEIDIYLEVVKSAHIEPATTQPKLYFSPEVVHSVNKQLEAIERPFLVVHPGGAVNPGAIMIQKRWPESRLIDLLNQLGSKIQTIVFTGGPDESRFCQRIANAVTTSNTMVVAGDLDLLETACLISKANVYVGVDTGVSHLAAATGAHCVVIFGPTNPLRYGPRGENVVVVAPEESYRIADRDLRGENPTNSHVSTHMVSLNEVLTACEKQLANARPNGI